MPALDPTIIGTVGYQLNNAERAARQIHDWVHQNVVARDVVPNKLEEPLSGLFDTLFNEFRKAKENVEFMIEFTDGAISKIGGKGKLTPRERCYIDYLEAAD